VDSCLNSRIDEELASRREESVRLKGYQRSVAAISDLRADIPPEIRILDEQFALYTEDPTRCPLCLVRSFHRFDFPSLPPSLSSATFSYRYSAIFF